MENIERKPKLQKRMNNQREKYKSGKDKIERI